MKRRRRRHLAWLDDAGAAGGQGKRKLLRHDQQRKIPGRDDRHDADGLAQDQAQPIGPEICVTLARQLASKGCSVAPDVGRAFDFAARLGDRLAEFERVEDRERSRGRGRSDPRPSKGRANGSKLSRAASARRRRPSRADSDSSACVIRATARHARNHDAPWLGSGARSSRLPPDFAAIDQHRAERRGKRASASFSFFGVEGNRGSSSDVHRDSPLAAERNRARACRGTAARPGQILGGTRSARRRGPRSARRDPRLRRH